MVRARGRIEIAQKRGVRFNVAIVVAAIRGLFSKHQVDANKVYKEMPIKDPDDGDQVQQVRHYSGSVAEQIKQHKAWLLTEEAKQHRASNN